MDEGDAPAVGRLGHDLVSQHDACQSRVTELLDVRAAQAAGEHAHELSGPVGLGDVGELGLAGSP